jgi:type IV pilus assembly protein PilA
MMRNRQGFTLIELLIVVVIIGILAAIAIPKFSSAREKAYYSAIKSDLKNLSVQQEVYYSGGNYVYTSDTTAAGLGYVPSKGVYLGPITVTSDGGGWSATATHAGLGAFGCAIYYGNATAPTVPGTSNTPPLGVVMCADEF